MPWYEVAAVTALANETVLGIKAGGKGLCLVRNAEGRIYATQRRCPHAGGDLSSGWCNEGKLICPLHRYGYDLNSGKGNPGQGDYISTYPVRITDGKIFVQIGGFADKLRSLFK